MRNAGCELVCDDNEMMFKIKDQAWTSRKNEIAATEYDEKYEECRQKYNGFEQNSGQFDGWLPCDNKSVEKKSSNCTSDALATRSTSVSSESAWTPLLVSEQLGAVLDFKVNMTQSSWS